MKLGPPGVGSEKAPEQGVPFFVWAADREKGFPPFQTEEQPNDGTIIPRFDSARADVQSDFSRVSGASAFVQTLVWWSEV